MLCFDLAALPVRCNTENCSCNALLIASNAVLHKHCYSHLIGWSLLQSHQKQAASGLQHSEQVTGFINHGQHCHLQSILWIAECRCELLSRNLANYIYSY